MQALLLDTRNDKHFVGNNYVELAVATGRVTFDLDARTCTVQHSSHPHLCVNPTSHTMSWSDSWGRDEMLKDMAKDAVAYLVRCCQFALYRLEA